MRTLKKVDLFVQVVLILGFAITTVSQNSNAFILGYFVVGAWQGASMVVHTLKSWHTRKGSARSIYQVVTVVVLLLAVLSFTLPIIIYFFFALLFLAPFMAITYAAICYHETFYYTKRPLELI